MASLPSLFISHGAPDLPMRAGSTQDFLRSLLQTVPKPRAILAVSAHWLTAHPMVSTAAQPKTIYDFGGFPRQLYELTYPAPGSPELAERVMTMLHEAGFEARTHQNRGFDHGVWTPLILADPEGTIPVVPISLQPHESTLHHYQLGKALAPLRGEGVLIVASGAATHNLGYFDSDYNAAPPDWAVAFDAWLAKAILDRDIAALLDYRQRAPHAAQNHPTEEHLLPLFVALGAGGSGQQIHSGFTYGAFSMAAYRFD
ncbi:MAG: class III extradiol ring-cleavage dioxygenase [Nodosilinea sp.]